MNQNFVDKMRQIQTEALSRKRARKSNDQNAEVLSTIQGLLQDFTFADPALEIREFHNGFHIVYANSMNFRILVYTSKRTIMISAVTESDSMEIYHGDLNHEAILASVENALLDWYQTLF